jgi:hypothetical protein
MAKVDGETMAATRSPLMVMCVTTPRPALWTALTRVSAGSSGADWLMLVRVATKTTLRSSPAGRRLSCPGAAAPAWVWLRLLLERRADREGDDDSGRACGQESEDDAAAQQQEQGQSAGEDGVLPGVAERAGEGDG